jgi:serine/threonine protein kinase
VFDAGLDSFINEARLLAQFDHPSLLKVYRFWRANGTAYMVMPFYEGHTLKETLRQMGTPPDERWLTALLASLTEALAVIHAEHCLHRDIAPDNVLLLADSGRPLLLDFGAARQVIGDATHRQTASGLRRAGEALGREINPHFFTSDDFFARLAQRDHFLRDVASKPKLFIAGDDHEFAGLVKRRLAAAPSDES